MRLLLLCKRQYTSKDLIGDRYGRLYYLPVELGRRGWDVEIVTADYEGRPEQRFEIEGVEFYSVPVGSLSIPAFVRKVDKLSSQVSPDIVMGSSDTIYGWLARRVGRRLGIPFVFDIYDNYSAFASARVPGMKKLLRRVSEDADLVTVVSKGLVNLRSKTHRVEVLPNGVDVNVFGPRDRAESRARIGIDPSATIVGYVGGLGPDRGIDILVEAVKTLRDKGRDVTLLTAGDGDPAFAHPDYVDHRGVVAHDEVPVIINSCDVVVMPYPDTDWARYTSANKVFEYLASEVPVVMTDISDYQDLAAVPDAICLPGNALDMARAIGFQLDRRVVVRPNDDWSWTARARKLDRMLRRL